LSTRPVGDHGSGAIVRRATASLLGLAVGDALGATTEFMKPEDIRRQYGVHERIRGGGWLNLPPGRVTDDTEMSQCVARAILAKGGWDLAAVARSSPGGFGKPGGRRVHLPRGIRDYILSGSYRRLRTNGTRGTAQPCGSPRSPFSPSGRGAPCPPRGGTGAVDPQPPALRRIVRDGGPDGPPGILGTPMAGLRAAAEELAGRHPEFRFERYEGNATAYVADTLRTVFTISSPPAPSRSALSAS